MSKRKSNEERVASRRARWGQAFALVERGEASGRVCECCALVEQGMGIGQIADELGLSRSMVGQYLKDPEGIQTARRKAKAVRRCLDCGAPCNTDGSIREPSLRCIPCAQRAAHPQIWTEKAIIEAIHRWASLYGEPPSAADWTGAYSPEGRDAFRSGNYPYLPTVQRRFGSWNRALVAAGFEPRTSGSRRKKKPFPVPAPLSQRKAA